MAATAGHTDETAGADQVDAHEAPSPWTDDVRVRLDELLDEHRGRSAGSPTWPSTTR